jgi:nucleotide-binding universal stress UspA family protein
MSTILVGYVSNPEGEAALLRGIEEARLRGARLVVVNSRKGGMSYDRDDAMATADQLSDVEATLNAAGIEYDVRGLVRGQEVADDLVAIAEEESADLIVIGLRRRSPVGKLIMGSNAQRILLDAPCAVLAVKAAAED